LIPVDLKSNRQTVGGKRKRPGPSGDTSSNAGCADRLAAGGKENKSGALGVKGKNRMSGRGGNKTKKGGLRA